MTDSETTSRRVAARWIRSSRGHRVAAGVLGLFMFALGVMLGGARSSRLVCDDRVCELRTSAMLWPTEIFPIDPSSPPAVVLLDTRYGKNGTLRGKSLKLRWSNGDVELARGDTHTVEAQAVAVRARLAAKRGALEVGERPSRFAGLMGLFCGISGIAMIIDGLGFGIRRHVSFDPTSRRLSTHLSLYGLAVRRRSVVVLAGARLVAMPMDAARPGLGWLAIESPGQPAQSLRMLDVPMYRDAVDEVLREA